MEWNWGLWHRSLTLGSCLALGVGRPPLSGWQAVTPQLPTHSDTGSSPTPKLSALILGYPFSRTLSCLRMCLYFVDCYVNIFYGNEIIRLTTDIGPTYWRWLGFLWMVLPPIGGRGENSTLRH